MINWVNRSKNTSAATRIPTPPQERKILLQNVKRLIIRSYQAITLGCFTENINMDIEDKKQLLNYLEGLMSEQDRAIAKGLVNISTRTGE